MRISPVKAFLAQLGVALTFIPFAAHSAISLGTAGDFAVLAGAAVTNTGASKLIGDLGVSPDSSITGFPPGSVTGTQHGDDAVAARAQADLGLAYAAAAAMVPTQILSGQDLGGLTLRPGVYSFASSAQLSGILTLDYSGKPNAEFVFQIGSALTTASLSSVVSINGGNAAGNTVFWQIGSSATLGTGTSFEGHLLALQSITLNTGAAIHQGSALAHFGAVTLDTNRIDATVSPVPEPEIGALYLAGGGMVGWIGLKKRRRARQRTLG